MQMGVTSRMKVVHSQLEDRAGYCSSRRERQHPDCEHKVFLFPILPCCGNAVEEAAEKLTVVAELDL